MSFVAPPYLLPLFYLISHQVLLLLPPKNILIISISVSIESTQALMTIVSHLDSYNSYLNDLLESPLLPSTLFSMLYPRRPFNCKSDLHLSLTTFQHFSNATTIKFKVFNKFYKALKSLTSVCFSNLISWHSTLLSLILLQTHIIHFICLTTTHIYPHILQVST